MLAITSLSPNHHNADTQAACIQSWKDNGYKPVSLNHPDEIAQLKSLYKGIEFIPTYRTHQAMLGRPYVLISAMIDYAIETGNQYTLLINSDILIKDDHGLTEKLKAWSEEAVIFMHRQDYMSDSNVSTRFEPGFDGFFLNKKWLGIYPQSLMSIGVPWWDYLIPYRAHQSGVKIMRPNEPYLYHKTHNQQWSMDSWKYFWEIMKVECKLFGIPNASQGNRKVYEAIMRAAR